ncbi:MAG: dihydroneopterin aldolase, partial [Proteobacteria bacterium]|nr:dihydroneopterin aldolase [Pseudomonadota bacterium]
MTASRDTKTNVQPLRLADAERGARHVFVRDLELNVEIGVHRHERRRSPLVRINIDLTVAEGPTQVDDRRANV